MRYVIKREEGGKMVSRPNSKNSYTNNLQDARVYTSRESAQIDCCGNEYVVDIDSMLHISN